MQIFDIDVCSEDLLNGDFSVCFASKDGKVVQGFRIGKELSKIINSRWGQGMYKYKKSKKGKGNLKVRIYTVIVYFIFKKINPKVPIALNICRDFDGQEAYIREMFGYFLERRLYLKIDNRFYFCKLSGNSFAHKGAYELNKKKIKSRVIMSLENIERYIK